jgi:hypothetical protein
MNKCIYCKSELIDERAVDVCDLCGRKVWGDRMFNAIKQNMSDAREQGNLNQGAVCVDLKGEVKDCKKDNTFKVIE